MRHEPATGTAPADLPGTASLRLPARRGAGAAATHPGNAARVLDATAVLLATAFLVLMGRTLWLEAKAMLADRLIAAAFTAHVRDGGVHRPWGWADVHPVGLLAVPRLGERSYVLSGASGSSLAFGLGHVDGTASLNGNGNCVLAGHRDTRFAFLGDLRPGDEVTLSTHNGPRRWQVESFGIFDDNRVDLLESTAESRLTLITCWPFDGLTPSRKRYVVWCRPVSDGFRARLGKATGGAVIQSSVFGSTR